MMPIEFKFLVRTPTTNLVLNTNSGRPASSKVVRVYHKAGCVEEKFVDIRADIEESGWYDPYFSLATYWAPVIRQYVKNDSTYGYRQDYITRFDYDTNWTGNDNWDNFPYFLDALYGYVYYSVIETETHYFIHYMFFHPRDWGRAWFSIVPDEHENDMEGILLVISKNGSKFGSPLVMVTRAHTDFYQYVADTNVTNGTADNVDGNITFDGWRPVAYVEAQGHGVYGDEDRVDQYYLYDDVIIYRFNGNASEHPDYADPNNISYALIPIIRALWPKAVDPSYIGDGKTYDQVFTYSNPRLNFSISVPAAFDGDDSTDGGTDKANPPWGMHDSDYDDDGLVQGDWFFDPANFTRTVFSIPYEFSLNYTYNPYVSGEDPECVCPDVQILSPGSDVYVNTSSVNISWFVNDSSSLYTVKVVVDGNAVYTGKDKGTNWIVVSLEDGKHSVNISAMDIWGNYRWVYREFYVDTKMPRVTITSPVNDTYTNNSDVQVSWSGYDENGISSYDVYVNNTLRTSLAGTKNTVSLSLNEGVNIIKVVATDNSGKTNSSTVTVNVDLTPPTITVISPKNNSESIYNSSVVVEWNSTDNMGIDHFEVNVDGGGWTNVYLNTSITLENLTLYNHTVRIKAIDRAGNVRIISVVFSLNPSEPQLTSSNNNDSDIAIMSSDAIYLSWTIDGDYDHVELIIDNSTTINVGKQDHYLLENLSEGMHNVTIRVVYPSGEYVDKTYRVMVDSSAPSIEITSHTTTNNDSLVLSWNSSDNLSGIDHYEILVGGSWRYIGNQTNYTLDLSGTADGMYLVIVRAFDRVGNYAQRYVIMIVDRTPPTLQVLNPPNKTYISASNMTLAIDASDNLQVTMVRIYVNGTLVYEGEYKTSYLLSGLLEGTNAIRIELLDVAHNSIEQTLVVYVDSKSPTLTIISPLDGETISGSNITVRWTSSSDAQKYYVRLDDNGWIYVGQSTEYTFVDVPSGDHVVYVMAVDAAGNRAVDAVVVTVVQGNNSSASGSRVLSLREVPLIVLDGGTAVSMKCEEAHRDPIILDEKNISINDATEKAFKASSKPSIKIIVKEICDGQIMLALNRVLYKYSNYVNYIRFEERCFVMSKEIKVKQVPVAIQIEKPIKLKPEEELEEETINLDNILKSAD